MEIVTTIAPVCLAIIMFGLGLGLTIGDFTRVIKNPKDFLVGFLCQVILLPIIAFILINIISLPPEIALGVMVIAAAPGGVTSNILTKFADGDVALSVSLTAIVSLLSILIVPLIVFNSAAYLGIETAKNISMLNIALKMFITRAGLVAFILNLTMIFVGYYVAKFWTSGIAQRKCISLECGLQNGTLAVFVTTQLFDDIVFMVPTAAYALIMFCTSIIFVLIVRKIN